MKESDTDSPAEAEVRKLRAAIEKHRGQKADDRCIEDDDELYAALGDGIKCDRRVGNKLDMLANCFHFIENRCEGGGWASYAELEQALIEAVSLILNRPGTIIVGPYLIQQAQGWRKLLEEKKKP